MIGNSTPFCYDDAVLGFGNYYFYKYSVKKNIIFHTHDHIAYEVENAKHSILLDIWTLQKTVVGFTLIHYLTKEVLRVVDHASPGLRMAAWGFSSHLVLPPSGLGRLSQGSMQTNLGSPFLLQSNV